MSTDPVLEHATAVAVALDADGPLAGALILGPSGSGKSSLALSLIESCAWRRTALIADDAVLLEARGASLVARAPQRISGLIEVRGFGPASVRLVAGRPIIAAFALARDAPRLASSEERTIAGVAVTAFPLQPGFDAAARLKVILRAILARQTAIGSEFQ